MSALPENITTLYTPTPKVICDGDKESPHPRVFLTVNAQGFVDCPYCGKHYVLKTDGPSHDAH